MTLACAANVIEEISVAADQRGILIRWQDGQESFFHAIWLRDNCYCDRCGETATGIRFLRVCDLDLGVKLKSVSLEGSGPLRVEWQADGHVSCYGLPWLRQHSYDDAARRERRLRPRLWDASEASSLSWFDLSSVSGDEEVRLAFLETLRDEGFALLRGVTASEAGLIEAARLVGPVEMGVYGGAVFELNPKSQRRIIGNSYSAVPPHTDEGYLQDPLGIELIVCDIACTGGDGRTILVDGFNVAEGLRQEDPEAFKLLSETTLSFHRIHPGEMDMRATGRVICLDSDGYVEGIRYPARNVAPLDVPPDLVEPLYRALWTFSAAINDPANILKLGLRHGDCVVFDNHRVFHGREAFTGDRRMLLTSVTRHDFHSGLRILAKQLGRDHTEQRLPAGAGH